jgi:ligand-binding sensor domain-containing protein
MTMRARCCFGACLFLWASATLAAPGVWKSYTSMKTVRAVAADGAMVWAATSGGLFSWNSTQSEYTQFTNTEGLLSVDLTAVTVDPKGTVWSGASNGVLHGYSPADRQLHPILDIQQSTKTAKAITFLRAMGDTMLVGTEFGLSIFRLSSLEFGDTFEKFGVGNSGIRFAVQSAILFAGNIWACITDGQTINRIAAASLSSTNLLPPESWTLEIAGSSGEIPQSLETFAGKLYAGTSGGLYVRDQTGWSPVSPSTLAGQSVVGLATGSSSLTIATASGSLYTLDNSGVLTVTASGAQFPLTSVAVDRQGAALAGSAGGGVLQFQGAWASHVPNGPYSSGFINVAVDPDGVVWCASGTVGNNGFYRLNGKEWKSFTTATSPLLTDNYYRVSIDCSGSAWITSFGRGLVEVPFRSDHVDSAHVYDTNVGMVGLPNDPLFVVPSNVVCDGHGNRWASIINPADKRTLVVRTGAGQWLRLPTIVSGTRLSWLVDTPVDKELAVDAFDNLWAIVREQAYRGVMTFRNRGAIDSVAALLLTSADGLPSDDIRTIVVDRENDIWVGTDKGIGIIQDPENPRAQGGIAIYTPLTGLVINAIAVDALNQKWVGTNEGVVLLTADGTQVLANYTVENTQGKLIDNNIQSIGIDNASGTVYIGTLVGLSSLTSTAAAPKAEFDEIKVYPNPYRVPSEQPLTIDGLVENSSLKILTSDGRLVRDLQTPGGRIGFWDGKDSDGRDVASGIYIIVAYSEDGSRAANGKVAILRK